MSHIHRCFSKCCFWLSFFIASCCVLFSISCSPYRHTLNTVRLRHRVWCRLNERLVIFDDKSYFIVLRSNLWVFYIYRHRRPCFFLLTCVLLQTVIWISFLVNINTYKYLRELLGEVDTVNGLCTPAGWHTVGLLLLETSWWYMHLCPVWRTHQSRWTSWWRSKGMCTCIFGCGSHWFKSDQSCGVLTACQLCGRQSNLHHAFFHSSPSAVLPHFEVFIY